MINTSSNFVKNSDNHELTNLRIKRNNRRREMKKVTDWVILKVC